MSLKKRLLSYVTSFVCLISCIVLTYSISSDFNAKAADLTGLTSRQITDQMIIGWNLGNSLDSHIATMSYDAAPAASATAWGNPEPTKELIQTVKNGGFNTIRIPITWYTHIRYNESSGIYEVNPKWMNYVKNVVDYAYNEGLFVIINVHHEDWVNAAEFNEESYAVASAKLHDIWSQVSEVFKDYDQHLVFEGMNEPRETGKGDSVEWGSGSDYARQYINRLNSVFVSTVRGQGSKANSERLLMLPGYCASSDFNAINAIEIPNNAGNVALSVHAYLPYYFTMATDDKANHTFPGSSGWGENYDESLKTFFSGLKSISDSKNVPVIIGEFSASDFENTESRAAWAKAYLTYAKNANIPCVLWDNNVSANGSGEAHGYVYRLTNTWYPNSVDVIKTMMDTVGVTNYTLPDYVEYQRPEFSWDNIKIKDNWKEIYRSENGETTKEWGNIAVSNYKQYITENYRFAMIYDAETVPELVIQGGQDGWYRIGTNYELNEDNIVYFTYDQLKSVLDEKGLTVDTIDNLFLSATNSETKFYGLYAIDLNSEIIEEPPIGDLNGDFSINYIDLEILKNHILGIDSPEAVVGFDSSCDLNRDNVINCYDYIVLKRLVVKNSLDY